MTSEMYLPVDNIIIEKNIEYYISLTVSPGYALFINGPWGSGKTYLVKNYLLRKGVKDYIHISLYGLTTLQEIEDQFFKSLHPFMSHKLFNALGGITKTTISIFGGNSDQINFKELLPNTTDKLIVFDDIERCPAVSEALGFINRFIEHYGNKVIMLGDESKIEDSLFVDQKEKTIGRTFTITPAFKDTFDSILNLPEHLTVKTPLEENYHVIKSCFERSSCQNLRTLKFGVMEFSRFYSQLPDDAKSHKSFLSVAINTFFSICLELRSGSLLIKQISGLSNAYSLFPSWTKKDDAQKENPLNKIRERHFGDQLTIEPSLNLIQAFFEFGEIDKLLMSETINNSSFFYKDNSPSWVKLWHSHSLREEEFLSHLGDTLKEFENFHYLEIGELKHVVGILLEYSQKGLIDLSKDAAIDLCRRVITHIGENNLLKLPKKEKHSDPSFDDSSYGLQYHSFDDPVFKDLSTQIKDFAQKKRDEAYREIMIRIPEIMKNDPVELWSILTSGRNNWEKYPPLYRYPVLQHVDVDEFLKALIEMNPSHTARFTVLSVLKDRYQHHLSTELVKELPWLQNLQVKMEEKIPTMGQPMKYQFETLKINLDNIIKNVEDWAKQLGALD